MKEVSNDSFFWAHMAVIFFHLSLGVILILCLKNKFIFNLPTRNIIFWLAVILILLSLLSLVPIVKYKDEEIIIN